MVRRSRKKSKESETDRIKNKYTQGGDMVNNIIEINNLCKSYGDVKAVSDLSFCVKEGELFAFLGREINHYQHYVRTAGKGFRAGDYQRF